jgi:uncharacterized membrane protein YoaK (UPF0700 family)
MEDQLAPLVKQLIEMINTGVNFVSGQLPEVAKEILRFNEIMSIVFISVSILALIVFIAFGNLCCKWKQANKYSHWEIAACLSWVLGVPASLLAILINIYALVQIIVAPKLYLLEYLKEFLRHNN